MAERQRIELCRLSRHPAFQEQFLTIRVRSIGVPRENRTLIGPGWKPGAIPLGEWHIWSTWRVLTPRLPRWQRGVLPLNYTCTGLGGEI